MSTLLKTLLDIMLLRRGPESLPHSPLLLTVVAAMWLTVGFLAVAAVEAYHIRNLVLDWALTGVALALYSLIVRMFARPERLLRALTAILGCAALFGLLLFSGNAFIAESPATEINLYSEIILFWSIAVEGHIIARSIDRMWFVGFLLAMAVFIFQLQLLVYLRPFLDTLA